MLVRESVLYVSNSSLAWQCEETGSSYQPTAMIFAFGPFRSLQFGSSRIFLAALLLLSYTLTITRAALRDEDKEEILSAHNHYRSIVDPVATNMQKMVSYNTMCTYLL